jgi:cyclase
MLRARVIPCLLFQNGGLVKTVQFTQPKYVGDPLNAVRIFNEKEVDELMVLDIDATVQCREPRYDLIRNLAAECRMPLCYGGGVTSIEQAERIIGMGVEKVAISSAAVARPELVSELAEVLGNQSVAVVVDVKRTKIGYEIWTHNGTRPTGMSPMAFAKEMEVRGAGEIVVNSIDCDGVMKGYDLELVTAIRESTTLPITALGGAGSLDDIRQLIDRFGIIGAAAGSVFVFKGIYRAVLINYPSRKDKDSMLSPGHLPEVLVS